MDSIIKNLKKNKIITSKKIEIIMKKINRCNYCNCANIENKPVRIIKNQTISAPHIHAMTLEVFKDKLIPGNRILDIGCGSGYLTSCFSYLLNVNTEKESVVVGMDIYNDMIELTKKNIKKNDSIILSKKYGGLNLNNNVHLVCGNGWLGYKLFEKYDVINVGASVDVIPKELVRQLNIDGLMLIPVKNEYYVIRRKTNRYIIRKITDVRFVPLILKRDTTKANNIKCLY